MKLDYKLHRAVCPEGPSAEADVRFGILPSQSRFRPPWRAGMLETQERFPVRGNDKSGGNQVFIEMITGREIFSRLQE